MLAQVSRSGRKTVRKSAPNPTLGHDGDPFLGVSSARVYHDCTSASALLDHLTMILGLSQMTVLQRANQAIGLAFLVAGVLAGVLATEGGEPEMSANQDEPARKPRDISRETQTTPASDLTGLVHDAFEREIAHIQAKSDANARFEVDRSRARVLQSPLLAQMFPRDVFVRVPFKVHEGPALKGKKLLAWDRSSTDFAFDKDTGESVELPGDGCEGFARLLAKRKVLLRSEKDAKRIWDAYRAIFQPLQPPDAQFLKVSPDTWRLNRHIGRGIGDTRVEYFFEVRTNADGAVLSGKIRSAPVPK